MNLNGVYTITKNDKKIVVKNSIQTDGFQLIQNWFASQSNSNIQRINLFQKNSEISITNSNISSSTLSLVNDVFNIYKEGGYDVLGNAPAYFLIDFKTQKNIKAIGIDAVQTTSSTSNGNISISYVQDTIWQDHDDFVIPVMYKNINDYNKLLIGQTKKIYYLNEPINVNKLKIKFNDFCSTKLDYRIYSIYIYQLKQQYLSPSTITLYDSMENVLITKNIDAKIIDLSNNSVIFKSCLQFQQLDSTQQVCYISLDFYDMNEQKKIFSKAQFPRPWTQQVMQTVQIQYQLTLTNN